MVLRMSSVRLRGDDRALSQGREVEGVVGEGIVVVVIGLGAAMRQPRGRDSRCIWFGFGTRAVGLRAQRRRLLQGVEGPGIRE